ncbi:MAG: hypothetical protein ABSF09_13500, partial [Candidatus Bathyarchaeia archaeon]
MPIKFGWFAVTLLLLASGLIAIMSMVPTGLPHAEAQPFMPSRVTVYQTVYQTLYQPVYQTLQQTVYATVLQTVRMPVTVTSSYSIAWTVTASNFPLPSTTSHSISVTDRTQSSRTSGLGPVGSLPSLGPNPLSAAPLLAAGAVAGVAVAEASRMLLSRLQAGSKDTGIDSGSGVPDSTGSPKTGSKDTGIDSGSGVPDST